MNNIIILIYIVLQCASWLWTIRVDNIYNKIIRVIVQIVANKVIMINDNRCFDWWFYIVLDFKFVKIA
jgi:hypothetical protein